MRKRDIELTRRALLAGLAAGAGSAALGEAPMASERPPMRPARTASGLARPDVARLIAEAKLGGEVSYVVADAATGEDDVSSDALPDGFSGDGPAPPGRRPH